MDFFQAQDTARRKSSLLVFLFVAAVVMIIAVIYATVIGAMAAMAARSGDYFPGWWQPDSLIIVALATVALVALGSLFKTMSLRGGGGVVARSVGGVLIDRQTRNPSERRLVNVVEEMAIASGIRVPEVYMLPDDGINAFAAGFSPDDAAVGVTRGAVETLSRDELQGVVAHEFSHIMNGDMRLNIRLIGLLFGILLIALVGRTVLMSMRFSRLSGGRNRNSGGVVIAMIAAAIALIVIGYVGVLFGRMIQAAVSRQREYLADASAVQFTRNPDGIAGALKKIGAVPAHSRVENAHATETSHLFFANALQGSPFNLFATHPPLKERIQAIDPSFDGDFSKVSLKIPTSPAEAAPKRRQPPPMPMRPEQFIAVIAGADEADPRDGATAIESLPSELSEAARDPQCARGMVLALLFGREDATAAEKQKQIIARSLDQAELDKCAPLFPLILSLPHSGKFTLIDLSLPAVRAAGATRVESFLKSVDEMIAADDKTTLFEFAVRNVVARYLRAVGEKSRHPTAGIHSFKPLSGEISLVLSAVARAGATTPDAARHAFDAGAGTLATIRDRLTLLDDQPALGSLATALERLDDAVPPIKKAVISALATAAAADGTLHPAEIELLRAVAAAINCPAPALG